MVEDDHVRAQLVRRRFYLGHLSLADEEGWIWPRAVLHYFKECRNPRSGSEGRELTQGFVDLAPRCLYRNKDRLLASIDARPPPEVILTEVILTGVILGEKGPAS